MDQPVSSHQQHADMAPPHPESAARELLRLYEIELHLARNELATVNQEQEELRNIIDQRDREVLELKVNLKEMSMSFAERSDLKFNDKVLGDLDRSTAEIDHLRRCLQESVPKSEHERVRDELLRSTQKISRMQNLISRMQGLIDVLIERIEILMQNLSQAGRSKPEPMQAEIDLCNAQISR
eukprot:CAMPEP_0172201254 /NCGR_PEP_ID=MMETSP1050-20130122/29879_1 /TAXON_ID=233186 /ORGANISM="Cryptomonas curvata, Strain CCAP979/52" /LENGTH=181 /DNA_ID=CAMNT_0012878843 /DNA_START=114 /DNA_END=655 /DNA_ORIENTATION=+